MGMKIGERVVGQNGLCSEQSPRVTRVRARVELTSKIPELTCGTMIFSGA